LVLGLGRFADEHKRATRLGYGYDDLYRGKAPFYLAMAIGGKGQRKSPELLLLSENLTGKKLFELVVVLLVRYSCTQVAAFFLILGASDGVATHLF
jgi:hypothetical protein